MSRVINVINVHYTIKSVKVRIAKFTVVRIGGSNMQLRLREGHESSLVEN